MGVLKVNVGDAVTPDWRNIGCGSPTPALANVLGADSSTFEGASPGWTSPGSDSHEAISTDAAHSGAQSLNIYTDAPNGVYDGRTSIPGLTPSTGYDFDLWARTRNPTAIATVYVILQTYPVSGPDTQQTIVGPVAVSDSWVHITGSGTTPSDADHGDIVIQASSGAFGTAFDGFLDDVQVLTLVTPTGRLKLWDGTRWVREVCDDDTPVTSSAVLNANWNWVIEPTSDGNTTFSWHGINEAPSETLIYYEYTSADDFLSASTGRTRTSGDFSESWYEMTGGVGIADIILTHVTIYLTGPGDLLTWDYVAPERHPLKVWDGTAWQTVACLTPV